MSDALPETALKSRPVIECRDCLARGFSTGDCPCPPRPSLDVLDSEYCDENGEYGWFLKSDRTPTRVAAIKRARGDLDMWLDWTEYRVRTVWMRPTFREWYWSDPSWGVEKCEKNDPDALAFWEVTHAAT